MEPARAVRLAAAAVALAATLAACSKVLDTGELESSLRNEIARKAHVTVRSVSCPPSAPVRAGDSFVCTIVEGDGSRHHVTVTQTDDRGHLTYAVTD
jgi:hypothetical protein